MSKDYYKILEVERNASAEEIKKAYRKQAMRYHPDKNGGDPQSEEKFKECAEAFDVLSDPQKKQQYDTYGRVGDQGNPFEGFGFGMDDIFSRFGDIFGFGGGSSRQTKRGSDLRMTIRVNLNDIINGVLKNVKYIRQNKCKVCDGVGGKDITTCLVCNGAGQRRIVQQTPFGTVQQVVTCSTCEGKGQTHRTNCSNCRGQGTTPFEESVEINIPKGAVGGISLSLSQKGNWAKSGIPGDLIIMIDEEVDPQFKRESNNLVYDNTITVIDAILGKEQYLDTPHGKIKFMIIPGTEHGKLVRIQGKGVPDISRNGQIGDLFIRMNIKVPKNVTDSEKTILYELRNSENFN
jgi:molecular chaperone DnaJ